MPVFSQAHMNKPCQICGDVGAVDAISTCRVCKKSREHAYCMRNFNGDVPSVWTCEACELRKEKVSPKSGVNPSANLHTKDSAGLNKYPINSVQGRVSWEKRVDKGKTKYISAQEAIRLSSGTKQFGSARTNFTSRSPPRYKTAISGRAPLKPNSIPQKFSPPGAKANPAFGSSGHLKPPRQQQQTSQASKEQKGPAQASNELKENNAYRKEYANIDQPFKAVSKPLENIGTATRKVEKAMGKAPCSSSGSLPHPPKAVSGENISINEKHGDFVAENRNLMNISPQVVKTLPSDPSLCPSWKGSFKLPNFLNCELHNDHVQAHPPSRVRHKVFEFSRKMPQVLEFKLLPRQRIWTGLFHNDFPDNDDIGLYFFPSYGDRNENYISLVYFLAGGDFVMRNCINGVELLVFASVHLHVDFRKWNGNYFLWGVFRGVKTADAQRKNNREVALLSHPSIGADERPYNGVDSENDDMEIDMVGGIYVGKVDIVISKEPSSTSPAVLKERDFTCQSPSSNVSKGMCREIPPGFESYIPRFGSPDVCGSSSLGAQNRKYSDNQLGNRRRVMDPTA